MAGIDKQGSPFAGQTRSFTIIRGGGGWETCRSCGSTLYPSRREKDSNVRMIGGARMNVDRYVCRCGTGRLIPRELAA